MTDEVRHDEEQSATSGKRRLGWVQKWLTNWTTIPVWIGGLRPDATLVNLVDDSSGTRRKVHPTLRANEQGVVEARIAKSYRGSELDLLIMESWFKNQATNVTVQSYGLYRAIRLERDYVYAPGGAALTESPPDGVEAFDPAAANELATLEMAQRVRSHVNRVPVMGFNLAVTLLSSYFLALLTQPWVFAAGVLGIGLLVRLYMTPYLDGRKKMTTLIKAIGVVFLALLVMAVLIVRTL